MGSTHVIPQKVGCQRGSGREADRKNQAQATGGRDSTSREKNWRRWNRYPDLFC
jgi:hypothetical protein